MFVIEDDLRELSNIEPYLKNGGQIFFAIDDNKKVLACCMIAPRDDGDWEIMTLQHQECIQERARVLLV